MTTLSGYAAVIGDVVASRNHPDRAQLQASVAAALAASNAATEALQPLQLTIGDEFQGLYGRLEQALATTLLVRLHLIPSADVRFGVGWGMLTRYDPDIAPLGQDGPAWWAAREAIATIARLEHTRAAPRGARTLVLVENGAAADSVRGLPDPGSFDPAALAPVNAYLACRDELVAGMGQRDARLLLALLAGESQTDIAAREGVSQAAISQRVRRNGSYAIKRAQELLEEVTA
jgi:hypothetical protein